MTVSGGAELLVHVGLDTVALKGDGFTIIAKEGQKVKKGELLMEVDLEKVKAAGYDVITPVIICNSDEYAEIKGLTDKDVNAGDTVIEIQK